MEDGLVDRFGIFSTKDEKSVPSRGDLLHYPEWLLIVRGSIALMAVVTGLFANTLTIIALIKCNLVNNVASYFIISLSVADLLFCGTVLPLTGARFLGSQWVTNETLCSLVAYFCYGNIGVSLLSVVMVTIHRYVQIVHYDIHDKIYNKWTIAAMIMFSWGLSYIIMLPTLFGVWGTFGYDTHIGMCDILSDEHGHSSKETIFAFGFLIPCIVIIICYAKILYVVRKSERRIRSHSVRPTDSEVKRNRKELQRTKAVFTIFVCFLICYLPSIIVETVDQNLEYPGFHVIAAFFFNISVCINPMIYVIMNKQYRLAYLNTLRACCCCCKNLPTSKVPAIFVIEGTPPRNRRNSNLIYRDRSVSQDDRSGNTPSTSRSFDTPQIQQTAT